MKNIIDDIMKFLHTVDGMTQHDAALKVFLYQTEILLSKELKMKRKFIQNSFLVCLHPNYDEPRKHVDTQRYFQTKMFFVKSNIILFMKTSIK